jgi:hypothetical protein
VPHNNGSSPDVQCATRTFWSGLSWQAETSQARKPDWSEEAFPANTVMTEDAAVLVAVRGTMCVDIWAAAIGARMAEVSMVRYMAVEDLPNVE